MAMAHDIHECHNHERYAHDLPLRASNPFRAQRIRVSHPISRNCTRLTSRIQKWSGCLAFPDIEFCILEEFNGNRSNLSNFV